jgi:hypothetical protein
MNKRKTKIQPLEHVRTGKILGKKLADYSIRKVGLAVHIIG